jgi:hypothetical protein
LRLLVDDYRKNWALHYMREAEADLSTAETTPFPALGVTLTVLAMRKMQLAIYYSLGDPGSVAFLVANALREGVPPGDAILRFLAHFEWLIQIRSVNTGDSTKEDALKEAQHVLTMASTMVSRIVGDADA